MILHYQLSDEDEAGTIQVSEQLLLSDAVAILRAAFGSDLEQVKLEAAE